MGDEVYKNQQETKYHGVGNVPFPQASPSLKQREEQAFYEANSGDDCLVAKLQIVIKAVLMVH